MKNIIKETFKDITINIIMKVGSSLFSNKPNDIDYLCVSNNLPRAKRVKIEHGEKLLDVLVLNEQEYRDKINFVNTLPQHSLYNYQLLLTEPLYQEEGYSLPKFNMFDKEIKEKYLKSIAYNYLLTLGKSIQKHFYSKTYTHYYLILEFYKNNSAELTEKILSDVKTLREKEEGYGRIIDEIDSFLYSYEEEMLAHINKDTANKGQVNNNFKKSEEE